jgi:predicted Zn-dependent protease
MYNLGDEQTFATRYSEETTMLAKRKTRFTLMPLIALGTLSLAVSIPTLASGRLYAASPQRFDTVTVKAGDDLWTLSAARTASGGDVQATIDRVMAENHLTTATIQPGQRLRIPT